MIKNKKKLFLLFIIAFISLLIEFFVLNNKSKVEAQATCNTVPMRLCIKCACQSGSGNWHSGAITCATTNEGLSANSNGDCTQTGGESAGTACSISMDSVIP